MPDRVKLTEAQREFLRAHLRPNIATNRGFLKREFARKTYVFVRGCSNAGIIDIIDPDKMFPYYWSGTQITPAGRALLASSGKKSGE